MKYVLSFLFLLCSITWGIAQSFSISGTVYDQSLNEPLPGVNVILKNTTNGTTTDFDGNFTLDNVSEGDVLVFSYISFQTQEVTISNQDAITIYLQEDVSTLDEVVVVGYGTQSKKEITGAVAVVGSETIEELNPTRIEQALQGQVAGVNITAESGSPGSGSNIRIRGISTNGENRPLILVDGIRIEDLSVLNPGDIESMNVLKDATAGIYGVQAANGVILITTKTGRKNSELKFSYDFFGGFQQTSRTIPVLNATEYAVIVNEAFAANGDPNPFPDISQLGIGTNWQDEVFQNAPILNHNLTITGGTEKSTFSLSTGLLTQDGVVGGSKANFKRYSTRLNINTDLTEKLKLTANFAYTGTQRRTLVENTIGSVLYSALNIAPTQPVRDSNGNLTPTNGRFGTEVVNPIGLVESTFNRGQVDRISGKLGLNYEILEGLSITSNFQFNYAEAQGRNFALVGDPNLNGSVFDPGGEAGDFAFLTENKDLFRDYIWDTYLNYERFFGEDHKLNLTLGTSYSSEAGEFFGGNRGNLIAPTDFPNADLSNAVTIQNGLVDSGLSGKFDTRLYSVFARAQYNYKERYLVSGVIRRDGSSNFGPDNRFGYFPSGSIGWVATEEDFLSNTGQLDFLKIRASYGIIGNDQIRANAFRSVLDGEGTYVFNNQLFFGRASGVLSNPEIKWEEQKTLDIGFDARLFNSTIDITADYFTRTTDGLLLQPQVSGILGVNAPGALAPFVNGGKVRNSGFEFAIGYDYNPSEDFSFGINYNVTFLDNEVLEVNNEAGFIQGGAFGVGQDPPSRMEAGKPIGYFFGLETNGVFQNQTEIDAHATQTNTAPGDLRFVDQNGDGQIDSDDRVDIGSPIADATMGLNLSINYKNFDFGAYTFASIGNEIVRNYQRNQPLVNQSVFALNRWTGEGSTNEYPRVTTGATSNTLFSDFYVEDGSFVRIQNAQLGYTFSRKAMERFGADKLRVYVSANNIYTFTKYNGYDPSASGGAPIGAGIDQGFYPVPRTYLLGVNFKF
ncbi:SusC/RagA family TonB-linked outer membrane protein [Maribacter sp. 2304DJ31-5]|uniref:SusC/RagA family TonB-linked outer membrane protein n=1 Tax=Maribacter sp. 2304DJ31-5 TaxID=3386273 RepID=UPI0039BD6334